jgi:PQQ-like domain
MGDWPQFRFDPAHSGWNQSESVLVGRLLRVLWRYPPRRGWIGSVMVEPVVADGFVRFGSRDGGFYTLETNGSFVDRQDLGGEPKSAAVTPQGDMFVTVNSAGPPPSSVLYGFKKSGGNVPGFPVDLGSSEAHSPALADEVVYVACRDGTVYAFKANNGNHSPWPLSRSKKLTGQIETPPAVANGIVYVGTSIGTGMDAKGKLQGTDGTKRLAVERRDGRRRALGTRRRQRRRLRRL